MTFARALIAAALLAAAIGGSFIIGALHAITEDTGEDW